MPDGHTFTNLHIHNSYGSTNCIRFEGQRLRILFLSPIRAPLAGERGNIVIAAAGVWQGFFSESIRERGEYEAERHQYWCARLERMHQ